MTLPRLSRGKWCRRIKHAIMDSMLLARIISGVGVSYRARPDGVNLNYHLNLFNPAQPQKSSRVL